MHSLILFLAAALISTTAAQGIPPRGQGKPCGGIATIPCKEGLFCYIKPSQQSDPMGVCKPELAGKGERCLVFSANVLDRRGCAQGLRCKLTKPSIPDLGGVCVKDNPPRLAHKGEACGGLGEHPRECAYGLFCYRGDGPGIPERAGVCKSERAGKGEKCEVKEGGLLKSRKCAKGLTCKLTSSSQPAKGGVCVRKHSNYWY